jgi:resuscitation-promoting factor RpfB
MPVNGIAVGAAGIGALLLWSAVENQSVLTAVQDVVTGKKPTPGPGALSPAITADVAGSTSAVGTGISSAASFAASDVSDAANEAMVKLLAAPRGWSTGIEWQALSNGWGNLESGFNNQVYNGGQIGGPYQPDKAYGIAQALGHGPNGAPYPAGNAGNPPGAGGSSSPVAQATWGLDYIAGRYGSPSKVPGWLGGPYNGY